MTARMRDADNSFPRRAFTLVELLIAVLVLGILATAAASRFAQAVANQQALSAARRVAADLELLRTTARKTSQEQTITFTVSGHAYSTSALIDPDRPGQTYQVSLQKLYDAKLDTVDLGGDAVLKFSGFGLPDSGGAITVKCGSCARTVLIDADSGVASVQ